MAFVVYVDDNFHYMDESYRYEHKKFAQLDAAIAEARDIVDNFLFSGFKPGMTADALFNGYVAFGEDPFIVDTEGSNVDFSAWDYARQRCREMCGESDDENE